jgi:hypothetical protein
VASTKKAMKHVPPEKFARLRDRARMTNSAIARTMGVSPTRLTELTRTKGGSERVWDAFQDAVRQARNSGGGTQAHA